MQTVGAVPGGRERGRMERDVLLRALALAPSLLNARTRSPSPVNHAREKRKRGLVQRGSKLSRDQSQQMAMYGKNTRIESTPVDPRTQMAVSLISGVSPEFGPISPSTRH